MNGHVDCDKIGVAGQECLPPGADFPYVVFLDDGCFFKGRGKPVMEAQPRLRLYY
jgi:hypothetical protein